MPVIATALLALLVGPLAQPAAAGSVVSVCVVAGFVTVLPSAGTLPPFSAGATAGGYTFASVALVCVGLGVVLLLAPVGAFLTTTSGGGTGTACGPVTVPGSGGFCGTYDLSPGLLPCSGKVGGPTLPNAPGSPDWSFTYGLVILGHVDCPALLLAGNLALVAVPDASAGLAPADCDLPPIALGGDLLDVPAAGLLLGELLLLYQPTVGFCGLVVAGVAVMTG